MDSHLECAAAVLVISSVIKKKKGLRKKRKQRTVWVKLWLNRRNKPGVYNTLSRELRMEDGGEYKKFLRMTPENFDDLLNLVECDIKKKSTIMPNLIPPNIKLAATLTANKFSLGTIVSNFKIILKRYKTQVQKFWLNVLCNIELIIT